MLNVADATKSVNRIEPNRLQFCFGASIQAKYRVNQAESVKRYLVDSHRSKLHRSALTDSTRIPSRRKQLFEKTLRELPDQDSNLDKQNQNLLCYRYTIG